LKTYLSIPYFLAKDKVRQAELDECVAKNAAHDGIDRIYLFVDDGHIPPINNPKLIVVPIDKRLTYRLWLEFVESIREEHIAILANTDIYFDASLNRLNDILTRKNRFIALSRFDRVGGETAPHPRPQWSQDVWALNSLSDITPELKKAADFPLGVPRCDNKIVYEFAMQGWDLINPFPAVRSIHLHESNIRNYNKENDRTLIGGMAFIRPQSDLTADSNIEITVWPRKTSNISHVRIVNALEQWDNQANPDGRSVTDAIVALDRSWQYPAITEQWAFEQIRKSAGLIPPGCVYLAFPWATLIDRNGKDRSGADELVDELTRLTAKSRKSASVVTVCQHIRLLQHQKVFFDCGVTDIFWSHAVKGQDRLPDFPSVRIHPFPLFPVQVKKEVSVHQERKLLFSFVGARARPFYLSQSRNHILDNLADDPRGSIVGRDDWHYNKIVYDHQIQKKSLDTRDLIDEEASDQFRRVLRESIFSLCPSGSGPNSIRLWESIGSGAIPVILADTYAPPGDPGLWDAAAVFCEETVDAIKALPDRLEKLAADKSLLEQKRHALRQLWKLYGPGWFVHDIAAFFVRRRNEAAIAASGALPLGASDLLRAAGAVDSHPFWKDGAFLLNAATCRMLLGDGSFASAWLEKPDLRRTCDVIAERDPDCALTRSYLSARTRFEQDIRKNAPRAARKKTRAHLLGRNSTRTPLAYHAYKQHFVDRIEYVANAEDADVLVFGASPNISEHADEIDQLVARRPNLKLAVLSEEPLWDTTWSFDTFAPKKRTKVLSRDIEYSVLNHFTTPIFNFEKLPYFVTTDDRFFVRYSHLFKRNARLKPKELLERWKAAEWRAAFYAEKRHGDLYDFRRPEKDLYGLCAYRTRVAEAMEDDGILRVGQGWTDTARRQNLPDWHLDKLAALDGRSFVVSGLENTHYTNYLTEKLFDAFAVLGAPLFFASAAHRVRGVVNENAYINLFDKTALEAAELVRGFEPELAFAEAYLDAQDQLAFLFSDADALVTERNRVTDEVARALEAICAE
jgi:hypothetical protein